MERLRILNDATDGASSLGGSRADGRGQALRQGSLRKLPGTPPDSMNDRGKVERKTDVPSTDSNLTSREGVRVMWASRFPSMTGIDDWLVRFKKDTILTDCDGCNKTMSHRNSPAVSISWRVVEPRCRWPLAMDRPPRASLHFSAFRVRYKAIRCHCISQHRLEVPDFWTFCENLSHHNRSPLLTGAVEFPVLTLALA